MVRTVPVRARPARLPAPGPSAAILIAVIALSVISLSVILAAGGASAADRPARVRTPSPTVPLGVLATCEDLGQFCFAEGCGRDQIEAALSCRAACPSAVVMTLQPAACPLRPARETVLRRRG